MISITWPLMVLLAISYFFEASFYLAFIIVVCLGLLGEVVHLPENMPGGYDNPEGKGLHPAKALMIGTLLLSGLIVLGTICPGVYDYGFGPNS